VNTYHLREYFHKSTPKNLTSLLGATHQADAIGCQREIVKKIVKKDADYVIAVKKNQPSLYEQVEQLFKQAIKTRGDSLRTSSFNTKEINSLTVNSLTLSYMYS
jgi:hypothetical protein